MLVLLTYPPLLPPNPPHPNSLPSFSMRDMKRKIIVKIQLLNEIIFLFRLLFSYLLSHLISSLHFSSILVAGILSKRGKSKDDATSSSSSSSSYVTRPASRLVIVDDTANLTGKNKADSGSCC